MNVGAGSQTAVTRTQTVLTLMVGSTVLVEGDLVEMALHAKVHIINRRDIKCPILIPLKYFSCT